MTDRCNQCGFPLAEGHVCPAQAKTTLEPTSQGPMSKQDLFDLHREMSGRALDLMLKKNADYSGGADDPFKNFQGSLIFDVEPEVGTMIRMNDKFQRVHAFLRNGSLAVQNEGVMDIGLDLINYAVLLTGQLLNRSRNKAINFNITVEHDPAPGLEARAKLNSVPYDPEYVPMNREEWEKLYMGKIPPTVPIPEGFAMLRDGDVIQEGDMYMTQSHTWANALHEDFGTEYNAERMGTPMIRKFADIPVSSPCIIPEGYHELFDKDTVKENDLWLDPSIMNWVAVPKTPKFVGYYHNVKRLALRDGQEHFFVIRRDNE